jgi:hypothetical protein
MFNKYYASGSYPAEPKCVVIKVFIEIYTYLFSDPSSVQVGLNFEFVMKELNCNIGTSLKCSVGKGGVGIFRVFRICV